MCQPQCAHFVQCARQDVPCHHAQLRRQYACQSPESTRSIVYSPIGFVRCFLVPSVISLLSEERWVRKPTVRRWRSSVVATSRLVGKVGLNTSVYQEEHPSAANLGMDGCQLQQGFRKHDLVEGPVCRHRRCPLCTMSSTRCAMFIDGITVHNVLDKMFHDAARFGNLIGVKQICIGVNNMDCHTASLSCYHVQRPEEHLEG